MEWVLAGSGEDRESEGESRLGSELRLSASFGARLGQSADLAILFGSRIIQPFRGRNFRAVNCQPRARQSQHCLIDI